MVSSRRRSLFVTITLLGWAACAAAEEPRATTAVDFDREIQPLLTSRCLKCHGGDEPQAGLQFTDRDRATAALDSGRHAIVRGRPDESELIRRVSSDDPDERMPSQGEPLSGAEIDLLRRWIAAGADWPRHWAYRPLVRPPVGQAFQPDTTGAVPDSDASSDANWPRTPIDTFILATLREHGLTPAPPADKRTLLRRLYFDLIGLPPLPDEIDAFLADDSPDAYERVVDRLLASPHYGERWARHWMDLVHFAETHGHDQDRPRDNAWPYRDYLIRAFNADVPYARFVREQVAGDVLFPDDPWAVVATGFLAAGPWDESSLRDIREDTLDREIARYLDRDDIVTTVMNTFTSTTVQCARCHQHKFDPIAQHEYYALQAVFAATDKANRAYDLDPPVARRRRDLLERKTQLPRLVAARDATVLEFQQQIAEWERTAPEARAVWQTLEAIEFRSDGGATLEKLDDGSLLAGGARPEKDVYTITARAALPRLTGLRLDVLTHESLPQQGPGRAENGNLHLSEVAVTLLAPAGPGDASAAERRLELVNPQADFNQEGWSIDKALDGNADSA